MYQATTPTFICTVPDTVDLTQANKVVWTFVQGPCVLTKTDEDLTVDEHSVSVYLTQNETVKLVHGIAQIQLNWTYADGSRACSDIKTIRIYPNLVRDVI